MRRVRRKARQKVVKETDFVSVAHSSQSMKAATSEALKKVETENEVSFVCVCVCMGTAFFMVSYLIYMVSRKQ